jgi:hypothetical protein
MQAAEDGPRFDAPEGVNWSPRRRILVQVQVCSAPIVVARITAQQMEKVGQGRWMRGHAQPQDFAPVMSQDQQAEQKPHYMSALFRLGWPASSPEHHMNGRLRTCSARLHYKWPLETPEGRLERAKPRERSQ